MVLEQKFMNDEGYLVGNGKMGSERLGCKSGEGLHVDSDINGGLGLEGELLFSKARVDDAKMDEEEKKSGSKNRTKPIQVIGDSDDDGPIGSIFKLKRSRNPKRVKSGLDGGKVEGRAENSMVKDEDSGEMGTTLACFRNKVKRHKVGKDVRSGNGKGKDCASSVVGLGSKQVKESLICSGDALDSPLDEVLEEKAKHKRSRHAVMPKKKGDHSTFEDGSDRCSGVRRLQGTSAQEEKEGALSCNNSLDENFESLSSFIRKSQTGSVKKSRSSSSQKQRGETPASGDGLSRSSEGASEDVLSVLLRGSCSSSKLAHKIPKSEGGLNFTTVGTSIDPALVKQEAVETQRSTGGSLSCPVDVLASAPVIKKEVVCFNNGRCNKSSEGISRESVPTCPLLSFHSGSITDSGEKSAIPIIEEFVVQSKVIPEDHTAKHDGLDGSCDGASNDLLSGKIQGSCYPSIQKLTEDAQSFKNGLKQCSSEEKIKISENADNIVPKKSFNIQKTSAEAAGSNGAFDQLSLRDTEVCLSDAVQKSCSASFVMPFPDGDNFKALSKETCKGNTLDCGDGLKQPSEDTFEELRGEKLSSVFCKSHAEVTTRYDELLQPFGNNLENSFICTASPSVSIPVKMEENLKRECGFDEFPDGCSRNLQLQPSSNQTPGVPVEDSRISSIMIQIEGTSRNDNGLHPVFMPLEEVKQSNSDSPMNHEEQSADAAEFDNSHEHLPINSVIAVQQVHAACPENKLSEDGSKETSFHSQDPLSVKEEVKVTCSPTTTLVPKEADLEDSGKALHSEIKDKKLSAVQRAAPARKIKKRRHGDMAYEGDTDWEFLMHEQGIFENSHIVNGDRPSKTKNKFDDPVSAVVQADDGGAAAVAAGLKACAAGPVEKIKFKEVLKRRGGLQEYLECRNLILGLWSKDMSRVLTLLECGVPDAPSEEELPRISLIREIYAFLDHRGYINVGIASEKKQVEPEAKLHYEDLKESKSEEASEAPVADSDEGVVFILGRLKTSENLTEAKNNVFVHDVKPMPEATKSNNIHVLSSGSELSTLIESEECTIDNDQENGFTDSNLPCKLVNMEALSIDPSSDAVECRPSSILPPKQIKDSCGVKSVVIDPVDGDDNTQCDLEVQKRIIVIGAGPAGLIAARHLQRQGFSVTVLEARDRLGGRVYTDRSSLSVPVDLGASIITGVEADVATERRPDPSSLICSQLGLELTVLNSDCPLYDIMTGQKVQADLDEALEAEYNSLLDDMVVLVAQKGDRAMRMSLEDGLEYALKRRRMVRLISDAEEVELDTLANASFDSGADGLDKKVSSRTDNREEILSPLERRVMDWHFANLEYGCAALLKQVSLPYWNQDDVYGGFGGAHCMIKGGYSTVVESLGDGLQIHLNHVVTEISYGVQNSGETGDHQRNVKVSTSNGNEFVGDAVLITVPLGCLKAETIKFSPALPEWKCSSIQRLGFGVLNKVVLEFPEVFWDDSVDYFGATAEETGQRGQCFMFWNVKKTVGAPVLIALVVGKAAIDGQNVSSSYHVHHALSVLRKLFGEALVPDPVASVVTNWGNDPFSRGAYSYVAVGASGEDYDILGRPVENFLFFAGEATCKEHPDTVGGAMMSGLREAVRIIDIFNTGNDYTAEVEAMEAAKKQTDSERNEVRDILKRLEAVELSNVLYKNSFDGHQMLTKEALLRDMFHNAKTTAGRLHLAKELLNLSIEALKSFAGTKEGLGTLNSWILDSMGKDGTQLLRHCVRLLVLVSTDLLAVRLSGIGKTVKEKVCVHTSRDIRAVASQLVSVWIEVFRKEKAANGGLKLLRQTTASDSSKAKSSKDLTSGKLLRMTHGASCNRGNVQVPSSPGKISPSNVNNKKANSKPVKLDTVTDSKSEVNSLRSQGTAVSLDSKLDDDNVAMSEEEQAAFAAAEAARAAALAAAQAYASSEAGCSTLRELPKIPSFHKFARREQYAQMDDSDLRRRWSGGVLGRQDCISEIDSRNCRVRDWSVDFSAACANLDSSRMSGDNYTQHSYSNEVAHQVNMKEHSGESAATDSRFTKAWVDSAGYGGVKDYHDIERWQSQAAAVSSDFFHPMMHIRDEEDSNTTSRVLNRKYEKRAEESSVSQAAGNNLLFENQPRGPERIKKAIVDYVGSLLMPLYKARKIDKEGYKSIMKKSSTKVMEQTTDAEKAMSVSEFLDFKRKNKIRSFVDKLIEKHMAMNPVAKP